MQPKTANRLTAGVAVVLLIVLAVVLGALTPQRRADVRKRPSTFFTDATGARGLLRVMEELLPDVRTWRRPLSTLPYLDETNRPATLVVAGPRHPLSRGEAERLLAWVAEGGQLLLFAEDGWPIETGRSRSDVGQGSPDAEPESGTGRESDDVVGGTNRPRTEASTNAVEPKRARPRETFLGRLGVRLRVAPHREPFEVSLHRVNPATTTAGPVRVRTLGAPEWSGDFTPLDDGSEAPVAAVIRHGQGLVVAIADAGFVSNESLRLSDNAVWILDACVGRPGPVFIDEYHHGFGEVRGPIELTGVFLGTPWGWCALQLIAAGGLYALGYRRRMGRIIDPPAPVMRAASDLVAARAGLFQAARGRRLAADLIVQHLCRQIEGRMVQPPELLAFCRRQTERRARGVTAALFVDLARCYEATLENRSDADQALVELGGVVGRIQQELHHESRSSS